MFLPNLGLFNKRYKYRVSFDALVDRVNYVAQDGLELVVFLPQPHRFWDYRYASMLSFLFLLKENCFEIGSHEG